MNILHVNIRLAEGGAGGVAFALHQRLLADGYSSHFAYGYASGIKESPASSGAQNTHIIGTKLSVLANYACHKVFGLDLCLSPGKSQLLEVLLAEADIVHLHAPHHYFLPFFKLAKMLRKYKLPVVWTLHDYWPFSGRCGVVGECQGWQNTCGVCPKKQDDLPSLFDFSRSIRSHKFQAMREWQDLVFTAPSQHMQEAARTVFPERECVLIPNFLAPEFSEGSQLVCVKQAQNEGKRRLLLVSADLSSQIKYDVDEVEGFCLRSNARLVTIGRHSPFLAAENHDYIKDKAEIQSVMNSCDALLFTSTVDTFGLVIIEALAMGLPVLATDSPAARFILSQVGGRPVANLDEAAHILRSGLFHLIYESQHGENMRMRTLNAFNFEKSYFKYLEVYRRLLPDRSL